MKSELVKRAFEIVDDAIFLSGDKRRAYLQQACGEDSNLRAEVESILRHEAGLSIAPAEADDRRPDLPQQHFGADRYELYEEIARGGMGLIVRAHDRDLHRDVAVKIILDSQSANADAVQRFANEAHVTAQLEHPGIPPVHDLGHLADGRPFLAMKLIKGQTLSSVLADRDEESNDPSKLLVTFEQLCQTVAYAHAHDVVHRDLKPDNVMVGQFGEVQVMDWGLAKRLDGQLDEGEGMNDEEENTLPSSHHLHSFDTRAGTVMGTPVYMPPEQTVGQRDKTTDVFALGAILCEILTGTPPYTGTTPIEVFAKSARGDLDEAFQRLDDSSHDPPLIQLTKQCLAATPDERFADAHELAAAFSDYIEARRSRLREAEIRSARAQAVALVERRRRHVTLALTASVLIIATLGLGGGMWISWQRAQHAEEIANVERQAGARAGKQAYRNAIVAAFLEFESGRYLQARELLHDAPETLRNWEWHYLRGRIDQSLRSFSTDNVLLSGLVRGTDLLRTFHGDRTVRLWHRWTGREVEVQRVDYGGPLVLGPEGNLVLSAGEAPILWDARTGQVLQHFDASLGAAVHLSAISRGGSYVAIHARDGTLKLIETEGGELLHSFPDSRCTPLFSRDGWLVWCDLSSIRFWDCLANREPRPPLDLGSTSGRQKLAISPDRSYLAWRTGRQIQLWNLQTGDHHQLAPVPETVDGLMFTDDSRRLVSTLLDGRIQLWRVTTNELLATLRSPSTSTVNSQGLSCEGNLLMTHPSAPDWQEIRLWDLDVTGSLVLMGHTSYVYPVMVSPDGKRIASGAWDGTVRLWDPETSEEIVALGPHPSAILALAFDPKGERLVAGTADQRVLVWNAATGQLVDRIAFTDKCYSVAFTPDNAKLVVADGGLTVVDAESLEPQQVLVPPHEPGEAGHVTEIIFGPSGDSFATFSGKSSWAAGRKIAVWDAVTLEQSAVFEVPFPVNTATYSPDGAHLAVGHYDGQITVWDVADFTKPVSTIRAHDREVFALQYLSDGTRLVSGGRDGKIRIWDMDSNRQLGVLAGHYDYVYSLALSPDGQRLVSGSGDHTVRIWETFPLARRLNMVREAKSLRPRAEALVDQLLSEKPDLEVAIQHIKSNADLPAALRRQALNVALRRSVASATYPVE